MVETERREAEENIAMKRVFLILSTILLSIGTGGGPLIMRLYYIHGGKRIWLSSFLETAAFPIMFIPLAISYLCRRRHFTATQAQKPKLVSMKPRLFVAAAGIGMITGVDNYLYAYGLAQLPVSTSSLIISTQLVFTACFAFLLVRHKFTAFTINAVVLLTIAAAVLGMGASVDRPSGESTKDYVMGFVMTILAALLYGFILPLVELVYKKTKQVLTFSLVMETQIVMNAGATLFCIIGMIINNDFKVIPREAKEFELGEAKYYVVLVMSAVIWQTFFVGVVGVIFCASSMLSGIIISVLLPVTEVLAVFFYHEKFQAEKGVSLTLSLWGFCSYFYGEIKQAKKKKKIPKQETELLSQSLPNP
ncbi:hypothetical protein L6164_008531 [Bauhinia variegata]|uniref:Uncharacterized protein n=1 Tax=Bauhinia variegata TaxID=167791 RepID=A0ACB9PGZ6_BAUVA|nr:hypothetical protein L6164_008531 [Bauhinia variegata]